MSNAECAPNIDYSKCILCQKKKSGVMVDPLKSRNRAPNESYELIIKMFTKYDRYCKLPFYLSRLLKTDLPASFLENNKAIWHKACRLKYGDSKLNKLTNKALEMSLEDNSETANLPQEDTSNPVNYAQVENNSTTPKTTDTNCLFCVASDMKSHIISKISTYEKIKKSAKILQDNNLLRKLGTSINDLDISRYHLQCITSFYNRSRIYEKRVSNLNNDVNLAKEAYFDLCLNMERSIINDDTKIFCLDDLRTNFTTTMTRLGISSIKQASELLHLNVEILKTFPLLQEFRTTQGTFLAKATAISSAIAFKYNHDHNESILKKAATIVRKDMKELQPRQDNDLLHQEESISKNLKKLMTLILEGHKVGERANTNQAVLSVCQIIQHNTRERSGPSGIKKRHRVEYETPLTRYLALFVYSLTRKKALVNKLSKLGICINYSRVLQINTNIANSIYKLYLRHNVVYPPHLPKGLFVTTAVDNVDHNLSATGARGSFHGTSISINVHPDNNDILPENENLQVFAKSIDKRMKPLPTEYSFVEPYSSMDLSKITVPSYTTNYQKDPKIIEDAFKTQYEWLSTIEITTQSGHSQQHIENNTWSSFFGHQLKHKTVVVDKTGLLPLLHENVNNPSTIRHAMKLAKKHTNFLNPEQCPVLAVDQPLFAIAKQIQWLNSDEYGEDKITIMFGGLHIEKIFMSCIGDWLKGSDWDLAIAEADIFTAGTAQSCLHASHITNTRLSHQITAAALYIMKNKEFIKTSLPGDRFEQWELDQERNNPQFLFWNTALKLELVLLIFIKANRERNFKLYLPSLEEMVPWFFALGHYNYARWISVHIRDMQNLEQVNPGIWRNFNDGKFVVQKTDKCFSAMAIDQCHEQHNATVKGDSGVIGLTNNRLALLRWTVAEPEIARLIRDFDNHYGLQVGCSNLHHEMNPASQGKFMEHVKNLLEVFENHGNPFMVDPDLVSLIRKFKFNEESIVSIRNAKEIGVTNYVEFITSRFIEKTKTVLDPIKTISLMLMREKPTKKTSKKLNNVKKDRDLFMKLFIQAQHRKMDLDNFFSHENQPFPPSISDNGYLTSGNHSDILECLLKFYDQSLGPTGCTATVIDGEAVAYLTRPSPTDKTFDDYFNLDVVPYLSEEQAKYDRVDIVFCNYSRNHLINAVRDERQCGRQQRVVGDACLPRNWLAFLRDNENKNYLLTFLTGKIRLNNELTTVVGDGITSNQDFDSSSITFSNHEQDSFRIFVAHIQDLVKNGHKKIILRTLNVTIVVLSISIFHLLEDLTELWIAFGVLRKFSYIPVHNISRSLGIRRAVCLPFFDSLTGSGRTSAFNGYGKIPAFKIFMDDPDFIDITTDLIAIKDISEIEALPKQIEKCVSYLYDKKQTHKTVNATRKFLFTKKNRCLEKLPPTKECLFQHFKRAMYEGILMWSRILDSNITLPSPLKWGWTDQSGKPEPLWSSVPINVPKIIKCGCKKKCTLKCRCRKVPLSCTLLCDCDGKCFKNKSF